MTYNFFVQYLFSASVTSSNYFELTLTVFEISDITKYFANVLFSFTNLSQGNFLYYPKFFIPTKVLHTARTPAQLKQNFLH